MSQTSNIITACIFFLFPVLAVIMHWVLLVVWLKRKIKRENEKVASGLPGVPFLFVVAAFAAVPYSAFRNVLAIAILILDPMNWLLLYQCCRWLIWGKFYE